MVSAVVLFAHVRIVVVYHLLAGGFGVFPDSRRVTLHCPYTLSQHTQDCQRNSLDTANQRDHYGFTHASHSPVQWAVSVREDGPA